MKHTLTDILLNLKLNNQFDKNPGLKPRLNYFNCMRHYCLLVEDYETLLFNRQL